LPVILGTVLVFFAESHESGNASYWLGGGGIDMVNVVIMQNSEVRGTFSILTIDNNFFGGRGVGYHCVCFGVERVGQAQIFGEGLVRRHSPRLPEGKSKQIPEEIFTTTQQSQHSASKFHIRQNMAQNGNAIIKNSLITGAGRGLFATKDLSPGESILTINRPLLCVLSNAELEETCVNCFSSSSGSIIGSHGNFQDEVKLSACSRCKQYKFCGKVC
jgi:hypothetical protein